jgi:hypothetical protein
MTIANCGFGRSKRLSITMNRVIVARTFCHQASADHHGKSSDDPATFGRSYTARRQFN